MNNNPKLNPRPNRIITGENVATIIMWYRKRFPVSVLVDMRDLPIVSQRDWTIHCHGGFYVESGRLSLARMLLNAPAGLIVDHINGRTTDNRRSNLRLATTSQNARNCKSKGTVSGFRGVYVNRRRKKRPYHVHLKVQDRSVTIGSFSDPQEAAKAYDAAAKKYFGEFARLNFP